MSVNENSEQSNHLQELGDSDFKIVEGQPNIKGWTLRNAEGENIGEVEELLFDPESRKVRYMVVDLEDNTLGLDSRVVLVPIGVAQLHEHDDDVILPNITAGQLAELPEYHKDSFSQDVEHRTSNVFNGMGVAGAAISGALYDHDHFNESNLYQRRQPNNAAGKTVVGVFDNGFEAQNAFSDLKTNGFHENQIDISLKNESDETHDDTGISNFFSNLMDDHDRATRYTEAAKKGSVVTVHVQSDEEARAAAEILDQHGSVDMDEQYSPDNDFSTNADRKLPVIDEELQVSKQEGETGGVRLRSKIIERPVEESIRLRSEKVTVERNPVNRPATEADLMKEETLEETTHTEVPVVNKEARIEEEITLKKTVEEKEEVIRDTVRSTEIDAERLNPDEDLKRRE